MRWRNTIVFKSLLALFLPTMGFTLDETSPAAEESLVIHSGEVQYDGQAIILTGEVAVQHGLGKIYARRVSFLPDFDLPKKSKFAHLQIADDVRLEMHGGGCLLCQQADIDYGALQGIFMGNSAVSDVTYMQTLDLSTPNQVTLKSQCMQAKLVRQRDNAQGALRTFIGQLQATQNVRVLYGTEYRLVADRAIYQRLEQTDKTAGIVTLLAGEALSVCQLTTSNGDLIQAPKITLNSLDRTLHLQNPKGTLLFGQETSHPQVIEFEANELVWDDFSRVLQLKGAVKIVQNGILYIETEEELAIAQAVKDGKKTLHSISAPKNIRLFYRDEKRGLEHSLLCPGALYIDHEKQFMLLQSPLDDNGNAIDRQVYVEDLLGDMYANQMTLYYDMSKQTLVPKQIQLQGSVRLLNRFDGHVQESGSILHYALADQVDYCPQADEMHLSSLSGNRVLFFDKVNNIRMSAPALKLQRDAVTQKGAIQGIGDVRFTFIEKELQQLKQRFQFEEAL